MRSIEGTHRYQTNQLKRFFKAKTTPFHRALCAADNNLTALHLDNDEYLTPISVQELTQEWSSKPLHGRYCNHLDSADVNKDWSMTYLREGALHAEAEGRICAIQDQVIGTRAYLKNIAGQNIPTDQCRKCGRHLESIQHITSACPILAPRDYLGRHDAMGRVFHQAIAKKMGLIESTKKPHEYTPQGILTNERYTIYWDTTIVTDRQVAHNKPDVVVLDKERKEGIIIDFAVPQDENLRKTYSEKVAKYEDLAFEIKEIYRLTSVTILPIIVSVNGLVEKHLPDIMKRLELSPKLIGKAQREVILGTIRTVRSFLTCS